MFKMPCKNNNFKFLNFLNHLLFLYNFALDIKEGQKVNAFIVENKLKIICFLIKMPLVDVRVPHNFRAFCCKLFFVCAL
jgi:hypothetical protein